MICVHDYWQEAFRSFLDFAQRGHRHGWSSALLLFWFAGITVRSHGSTIDQPAERRFGVCGRFGQDRLVIRHPIAKGVGLEKIVFVGA